jgi:hypothetical protein
MVTDLGKLGNNEKLKKDSDDEKKGVFRTNIFVT